MKSSIPIEPTTPPLDMIIPPAKRITIPPTPTITTISACVSNITLLSPTPDPQLVNICQDAELRARDLLQATRNVHYILYEIRSGNFSQAGPLNRINDLNNGLAENLWLKIAGYGLGTDPYFDNIFFSSSGMKNPERPPNYGNSEIGLPRLYDKFLSASHLSNEEIQNRRSNFLQLVQPYSNPAVYTHRDFYERAYPNYRHAKMLTSPQFMKDLEDLDLWLSNLEKVLEKIPQLFATNPFYPSTN